MKDASEVTCLVVDAGTFIPLAEKLSETFKKQYYYSPYESEYLSVDRCVIGDGLPTVERLDEFLDPKVFDTIDLFVFPDIGFGGLQRHLRSLGKAVWGSMGFSDYELYRTQFLKLLKETGLPIIPYEVKRGITELDNHLRSVENKWIKVNRYRGDMETWKHIDYAHSIPMLDHLRVTFGGVQELVTFVVQDDIETDVEIGYDGWCVDGEFPESSFQGYEKKNQLYLGSLKSYDDLPDEVKFVNEKMSPTMKRFGYRNFWATEIRIKDGTPFFIDPTPRMPGQTGEQLLESCSNLPTVIWEGANGILTKPEFIFSHVAEATLHYTAGSDGWKIFALPKESEKWVKLYQFCIVNGLHKFPPSKIDELGVVLGGGESTEEALDHLKENFEAIKDEPVSIELSGFDELAGQIEEAEKVGIEFSNEPLPSTEEVLS